MTFFEENKIEYIQVNVENMNDEDIFNTITVFVEKYGKFKNYMNHEEVNENKRREEEEK